MQESKLPFRHWFIAIHLLTGTKKSYSALELQRQIGHKYYEPIWYMAQKLRLTMGSRDRKYQLEKIVELDEGFFESGDTEKDENKESAPRKRGRLAKYSVAFKINDKNDKIEIIISKEIEDKMNNNTNLREL